MPGWGAGYGNPGQGSGGYGGGTSGPSSSGGGTFVPYPNGVGPTGPKPTPPGWTPPPAAVPPVDFLAMARALYPWLPSDLLGIFADAWDQHGDPNVALGVMRQSPAYDAHFPGNRRSNGTFRLSEQEYLTAVDGYQQSFASYGLNPSVFSNRYAEFIEGDVSVNELAGRLSQAWELMNSGPMGAGGVSYSQKFYAEAYGISMTPEAAFASFIDPDLQQDILNRRVAVSQVGGGALAFGFQRTVDRVERLLGMGLTGEQASRFYAGAAAQLPQAQALARRFNNREGVDVGTLEDAGILGDAQQARRLQANVTAEQVSFDRRQAAGRDQQGRVFGLERQ